MFCRGSTISESESVVKNVEPPNKGLHTTVNSYNAAYKELGKIDKDVLKITGKKERETTLMELEKPQNGDQED